MSNLENEYQVKRTDGYTIDQLEWLVRQTHQRGIIANNPARTHFVRVCEELILALKRIETLEKEVQ